jgi:hypothetical protein
VYGQGLVTQHMRREKKTREEQSRSQPILTWSAKGEDSTTFSNAISVNIIQNYVHIQHLKKNMVSKKKNTTPIYKTR